VNGVLVIDKPGGMTSHDVVQRIRKLLKTSKVGHLGTLDPMATGVLPLCVGKATRMGQFLASSPKEYTGEIRFGFATSTYDREGERVGSEQPFEQGRSQVEEAIRTLIGAFDQMPPLISAKKIGGEPSYKLARRGMPVQSPAVPVEVERFELLRFEPPLATFRIVCSAGTYVRSLAHDLGRQLGCGAHLESLRRLRSGEFGIEQAVRLDRAAAADLVPMENLLAQYPSITVEGSIEEDRVRHGNPVATVVDSGLARIFNKEGEFLAVASVESGWARPRVVLTSVPSAEPRRPRWGQDT
jgi:tRNA pseudouridine55 synthase